MVAFWRRNSEPSSPAEGTGAPAVTSGRVAGALLLMLLSLAVSGLLLLEHHGVAGAVSAVNQVCGEGASSGCETVARSRFAEVGGVPLAAIGVAFAGSLALLLLLGLLAGPEARTAAATLAVLALALALLVDVALFGIQLLAIKAFCRLCLVTYAFNAIALVLLLPARRIEAFRPTVRLAAGRAALAGWVVATVAIAAAAIAGSAALRHRESAQPGALLGMSPAPAPSLAPAVPGSDAARYQEEARVAQEQARRLQEILDDPKKLDEYFAQKATREFDQGPVRTFNLKGTPSKGPQDAPIRVVEFSDFLCPFCRSIAQAFNGYLPQSGNRVIVYFKNYPLDKACNKSLNATIHPGACLLALGAICANEQGRFWPYHDRVFSSPPNNPQVKDVVAVGTEAGLNGPALEACLANSDTQRRLEVEIAEGAQAQVEGTPTLYINGKRLPRLADFIQTVDREAAKMGLPPLPSPTATGH